MAAAVELILFVGLCTLLAWAAGFLIAEEDVFGGQRTRFENWAYVNADSVRAKTDDLHVIWATEEFWDRARWWAPFRRGPQPGVQTFGEVGVDGRRVPHRSQRDGRMMYGVPLLDGKPLGRLDRLATVLRTKVADAWGCPICSGWWGGLVAALAVSHWGPWRYGWLLVGCCMFAGWGLARRLAWITD